MNNIDYDNQLETRGVLSACRIADWQLNGIYWKYPIWDLQANVIGHRLKRAIKDDTKAKYLWHKSKPQHPLASWYIPPPALSAIKAEGGMCYLANGEISVMAFHSAQIYNVISTTEAEMTIPDNAIEILNCLGVVLLVNIADNDKAGHDSSDKWHAALAGSGIQYKPLQWDKSLGAKADANDAWIKSEFDSKRFKQILKDTKALPPAKRVKTIKKRDIAPREKPQNPTYVHTRDEYDEARKNAHIEMGNRLGVHEYNEKGFSKNFPCINPHHDDRHASAGFNIDSGIVKCFVCGTISAVDVANYTGVNYPTYYEQTEPDKPLDLDAIPDGETTKQDTSVIDKIKAINEADAITITPAYEQWLKQLQLYQNGDYQSWHNSDELPMSLYSAVLVLCTARSAVPIVIGKMHKAAITGRLNFAAFTIDDVVSVTGIQKQTIGRVIATLIDWRFINSLQNVAPNKIIEEHIPTSSVTNSGRVPQYYSINTNYGVVKHNILSMLKIYYTEKHFTENIAQRTEAMAALAGIYDMDTFMQWHNRVKTIKYEADNRQAESALNKEFTGDGHGWVGWYKALQATGTPKVDWDAIDTTKDLRAAILRWWVIDYGRDVNSVEQLERLLGCSATTVKSARIAANLRSIERKVTVEYWRDKDGKKRIVARTSDYELKAELENKLQPPTTWNYNDLLYYTCKRVLGAPMRSWIKIKGRYVTDADGNYKFTKNGSLILESLPVTPDAPEGWAMNANIVMFSYQISLPSRYVAITDDEISDEQQAEQSEDSDNEATESAPKAKRNAPQATKDAHNWHEHTTNWIYQQLRLEVAHFTDYELKHRAIYKDGERVQSFKTLREIVVWLNSADSRSTR